MILPTIPKLAISYNDPSNYSKLAISYNDPFNYSKTSYII